MPDINTVLDRVKSRVETLGFQIEGNPVAVIKRKLPKRQPSDPTTLIVVCLSTKEEEVIKFTTLHNLFRFFVQIVLLVPNRDDQLTTLPDHARFREQIVALFRRKPPDLLDIDGLRNASVVFDVFLDRNLIQDGWDYQMIEVTLEIVEDAF